MYELDSLQAPLPGGGRASRASLHVRTPATPLHDGAASRARPRDSARGGGYGTWFTSGLEWTPMRYTASSLMARAVFLGIGLTWGADPPTLEELAAAIEGVRTGPDGERVVVGHISRKVAVSVEALRAQRPEEERLRGSWPHRPPALRRLREDPPRCGCRDVWSHRRAHGGRKRRSLDPLDFRPEVTPPRDRPQT